MKYSFKGLTILLAGFVMFFVVSCKKETTENAVVNPQKVTQQKVYLEDRLLDLTNSKDAADLAAFVKNEPNMGVIAEVQGTHKSLSETPLRLFKNKEAFHTYALKNKLMTEVQVKQEIEAFKNPVATKGTNNPLETRDAQPFYASFYEHGWFEGQPLQYILYPWNLPFGATYYLGDFWNDRISSLRLDNRAKDNFTSVYMYEHANYQGFWLNVILYPHSYLEDDYLPDNLAHGYTEGNVWSNSSGTPGFWWGRNWDDKISSILIYNF